MSNTISLVRKIKERKHLVNSDINAEIKLLQKALVKLCFANGNNTKEYFETLGEINRIRANQLNGASNV